MYLLSKYLFVCLKGKEGNIFNLLIHSPNICNNQCWPKLKPRARNSTEIPHNQLIEC